jgi:N-methylhydantoinase A
MEDPPELVHLRVRAVGEADKPTVEGHAGGGADPHVGTREAYCFAEGARREFDVYERAALPREATVEGPAIVREPTSTAVFHSDQTASLDEFGQLIVTTE